MKHDQNRDPGPRRQVNVRLPQSLIEAVDARRAELELSRDAWVERAIKFALQSKSETGVTSTPRGRTALPPHRRR